MILPHNIGHGVKLAKQYNVKIAWGTDTLFDQELAKRHRISPSYEGSKSGRPAPPLHIGGPPRQL